MGICFYFQFLMFAPNAGTVLEMKYDHRIVFPSNDSGVSGGIDLEASPGYLRNAEVFSVGS